MICGIMRKFALRNFSFCFLLIFFLFSQVYWCLYWNKFSHTWMTICKGTVYEWKSLEIFPIRRALRQITMHSHQRLFKLGNGTTKTNGTNIVRFAIARRDNTRATFPTHALQISSGDKHRLIRTIRFLRKYPC